MTTTEDTAFPPRGISEFASQLYQSCVRGPGLALLKFRVKLRQPGRDSSPRDLFPIAGRAFDTADDRIIARLISATSSDSSVCYKLEFSNGKELTLLLSRDALQNDGAYRAKAFELVRNWLVSRGTVSTIAFYKR